MNTQEIMNLALDLSGFDKVPADSRIYNPGDNIERVLFGVDIGEEDLFFAKQQNFDLVISHHPPYHTHRSGFFKVLNRHKELMVGAGVGAEKAQKASDQNKAFWRYFFKSIDRQKTFGLIFWNSFAK